MKCRTDVVCSKVPSFSIIQVAKDVFEGWFVIRLNSVTPEKGPIVFEDTDSLYSDIRETDLIDTLYPL